MSLGKIGLKNILPAFFILLMAAGCVEPRPEISPGPYYLNSGIAYLRDVPSYDGYVVGQLYRGDQAERLGINAQGWWRVRSSRTNQTGWVQGDLFGRDPVALVHYYVIPDSLELRESPDQEGPPLHLLFRGEQVQKIEENGRGWWRVLVPKTRNLGWVQAGDLSEKGGAALPEPPKSPFYYVAVRSVAMHSKPLKGAGIAKTLPFNEKVKLVEENPDGWVKVTHAPTGAEGWVDRRCLESSPQKFPRTQRFKKFPRWKKPGESDTLIEPEAM